MLFELVVSFFKEHTHLIVMLNLLGRGDYILLYFVRNHGL